MSIDLPPAGETGIGTLPDTDVDRREGPEPAAHGSSVGCVFNDVPESGDDRTATFYDRLLGYWRSAVGDRDAEPHTVATVDPDDITGLPPAREGRDYILELTSSRWKAGTGEGDDYSAYYEYHLKLREFDDEGETYKPPLAIHVEIMPQFDDLVYSDGNSLETPYGEGTRAVISTTWAESADVVETRLLETLAAAFGDAADVDGLREARNPESRRIQKIEAHVRFDIGYKRQVVDALRHSEELIAYGGQTEIESFAKRQREGWLEAFVNADRWHLLGFERTNYAIETKVYQANGWQQKDRSDPFHHPKLEASFAGVSSGKHPHVDDWDENVQILREVVNSHMEWAGVDRGELVADDFFDGSAVDSYEYRHPEGRREQLKARYDEVATHVYKEALKAQTQSVYDILRTLVINDGATYDVLEASTGLARSTIRYHVRRLQEAGVCERVGNPTLVVFPSLMVLREAQDVIDRVYPDDTLEDKEERADERRRDREERADPGASDDSDDVDASEKSPGETSDGSCYEWASLADLPIGPDELSNGLRRDYLDDDHVRIRTDPYEWLG